MALFIDIEIAQSVKDDPALCEKLAEVCPVDIFDAKGGGLSLVDENLDECTLCDLCIEAAPKGTVRIVKLYES